MRITPTKIAGVAIVEIERREDERGFFARAHCDEELRAAGLDPTIRQINLSFNEREATLRGMHYQDPPHEETKIVRCIRGSIFDVALDLRPDSPTFCQWVGEELSADNRKALYVGPGCAHGFITLNPGTELLYLMGSNYVPGAGRGVRWDDSAFAISWPRDPQVISSRDAGYPDFAK